MLRVVFVIGLFAPDVPLPTSARPCRGGLSSGRFLPRSTSRCARSPIHRQVSAADLQRGLRRRARRSRRPPGKKRSSGERIIGAAAPAACILVLTGANMRPSLALLIWSSERRRSVFVSTEVGCAQPHDGRRFGRRGGLRNDNKSALLEMPRDGAAHGAPYTRVMGDFTSCSGRRAEGSQTLGVRRNWVIIAYNA